MPSSTALSGEPAKECPARPLSEGLVFHGPSKTLNDAHFLLFSGITGDVHRSHYDVEYAKDTRFGKPLAHGLLLASLTAMGASELRDHIDAFRKLADLYLMVRNAYGSPTRFYEDVARKTEQMIRETANSYGPVVSGKTVEFDLKTLQSLRTDDGDDNATVINLVRSIEREAGEKEDEQPVLVDIAQRAQAILDALEQRTVSTQQALEQLELLAREREQADAAREELGLPPATFAVYWHLQGEGLGDPLVATGDIMSAADRYPNHVDNDDERRKLKAEIYRILLLQKIDGGRMVALGEATLRLLGRDRVS